MDEARPLVGISACFLSALTLLAGRKDIQPTKKTRATNSKGSSGTSGGRKPRETTNNNNNNNNPICNAPDASVTDPEARRTLRNITEWT